MTTVEEYCRDILILHHGKTILTGDLSEIKNACGRTNLVIRPRETDRNAFEQAMQASGLELIEKRAYEYEYRISGEDDAYRVLKLLAEQNLYALKYVIKEPSPRKFSLKRWKTRREELQNETNRDYYEIYV